MASQPDREGTEQILNGEHEVQLRLLRAVEMLLADPTRAAEHEGALAQLIDYTEVHFLSEQLLMRLYAYPQQAAHERRHAELMEHTRALAAELAADGAAAAVSLAARLRQSVCDHIAGEDAALSRYLLGLDPQGPSVRHTAS